MIITIPTSWKEVKAALPRLGTVSAAEPRPESWDTVVHPNRGVPYLAPVMEKLKMLNRYPEAEVFVPIQGGPIRPAEIQAHADVYANLNGIQAPQLFPQEVTPMASSAFPAPVKVTFLQHAGSVIKRILHIGEEAAAIGAPIVQAYFPSVAPLLASAAGIIFAAEATASKATGTGPQKLAQVLVGFNPIVDQFLSENNLQDFESEARKKFVSAFADMLNLIPAPKAS